MRSRFLLCFGLVWLAGCGLTLDLDPPDSVQGFDGGTHDAGASDGGVADSCDGAEDGTVCGALGLRICLGGVCVRSRCGDGFVDPRAGEECEDGNDVTNDGCEPASCQRTCDIDADCALLESACASAACAEHVCERTIAPQGTECTTSDGAAGTCHADTCIAIACGDGEVDATEECDDGNHTPADGCEPDCTFICHADVDCSDGIACNGVEMCARTGTPGGATGAACVPGPAISIDLCHACDPTSGTVRLIDADGDGFAPGDCEGGGDCDDANPSIHPGAVDVSVPGNGVDDDCDGRIDEDPVGTCLRDTDRDGFGARDGSITVMPGVACPVGFVPAPPDSTATALVLDCDDGDPDVFPGQTAWFTVSRCEGGVSVSGPCWDYDCNGVEEQHWPRPAACLSILGRTCSDEGWSLASGLVVPACGASGTWTTCSDLLGLGCLPDTLGRTRTQECH